MTKNACSDPEHGGGDAQRPIDAGLAHDCLPNRLMNSFRGRRVHLSRGNHSARILARSVLAFVMTIPGNGQRPRVTTTVIETPDCRRAAGDVTDDPAEVPYASSAQQCRPERRQKNGARARH
jgi:hypothetical protein